MDFRHLLLLTTLACGTSANAMPQTVNPLFTGKVVNTFTQEKGDTDAGPIQRFPVEVIEESIDGSRYRVRNGGTDVWIRKMDVKAEKTGIDAKTMCVTMVARAETGATRNANDPCRPTK